MLCGVASLSPKPSWHSSLPALPTEPEAPALLPPALLPFTGFIKVADAVKAQGAV